MNFTPIIRSLILFLIFLGAGAVANAQEVEKKEEKKKSKFDPSKAVLFVPNYTAQFPYGNMADRFGFNSLFGMQIDYKVKKNWIIGIDGAFLFGTKVREAYVLDNISTYTGQFITQNNELARVTAQEQGFNLKLIIGKIIPFSEKYPDAGLLLMTGFGFLEHKIAINVRASELPQLDKTYRKGYDRLSSGPVISQFIGGIFLERKRFVSVYGGLQFDVGFTQGRRNFDFYSMAPLKDKRLDMFLGIKVGWVIPVFTQVSEKEYFYY
jgi:hypothetical protein